MKRVILSLAIITIPFTVCLSAYSQEATEHIRKSWQHAAAKEWALAMQQAQEAVRIEPDSADAHNVLGAALANTGEFEGGIAEMRRAIKLDPNNSARYCFLAEALARSGKISEAIETYKYAIQLAPNDLDSRLLLSNAFYRLGRFDDAIAGFSEVIAMDGKSATAFKGRAFSYRSKGEFAKSISDCERLMQLSPNDHTAFACRAFCNMRLGELDAALADADRVLKGDTEDVAKSYAYMVKGHITLSRGLHAESIQYLSQAIRLDPDDPLNYVILAITQVNDGQFGRGIESLDKAITLSGEPDKLNSKLDGYGWQVYKLRGLVRMFISKANDAAIADFTQAMELNGKDAEVIALRGLAHERLGNWKTAIADYEQALAIEPNHKLGSLGLIYALVSCPHDKLRDGRRALELATLEYERTEKKDIHFLQALAAAHSEVGNYLTARQMQVDVKLQLQKTKKPAIPLRIWWSGKYDSFGFLEPKDSDTLVELYKQNKPYRSRNPRSLESAGLRVL